MRLRHIDVFSADFSINKILKCAVKDRFMQTTKRLCVKWNIFVKKSQFQGRRREVLRTGAFCDSDTPHGHVLCAQLFPFVHNILLVNMPSCIPWGSK